MKLLGFKNGQSPANIFVPIFALLLFGVTLLIITLLAYLTAQQIILAFPTMTEMHSAVNTVFNLYKIFDYVAVTLCIIFIIGIGYTSYLIRAKPIAFIITMVVSGFYGFMAYVMSYIYSQFASNTAFTVILYLFPLTLLILTNLHWIALVMILVSSIALFSGGDGNEEIPLR